MHAAIRIFLGVYFVDFQQYRANEYCSNSTCLTRQLMFAPTLRAHALRYNMAYMKFNFLGEIIFIYREIIRKIN